MFLFCSIIDSKNTRKSQAGPITAPTTDRTDPF